MGWQSSDAPGHEGFLVGLVQDAAERDGWRELRSPGDDADRENVERFQVGCTCGWRSPRFRAPPGTSWWPFTLELPELHEPLRDVAGDLWCQHWRLPDPLAARADTRVARTPTPLAHSSGDASGGGRLELGDESGGLRHFLLGRAVHAGDGLELLLADGRWLLGRYENARGEDFLRPLFHFDLPCTAAPPEWAGAVPRSTTDLEAMVELAPAACLRWPRR
jgi:hypothetical protein